MDYIPPDNIDYDDYVETGELVFHRNPWMVVYSVVFLSMLVMGSIFSSKFSEKSSSAQIDINIVDQDQPNSSIIVSASVLGDTSGIGAKKAAVDSRPRSFIATVRPKDSLSSIFKRFGINVKSAKEIQSLKQAKVLSKLTVGKKIGFTLDPVNKTNLKELTYKVNELDTLVITSVKNRWQVKTNHITPISTVKYASATVHGSIYSAGKKIGIPSKMIAELVNIFSNKVNINDLDKGDKFSFLYKEYTVSGKAVQDSEISAAELVHHGQSHRFVGFTDRNGHKDFYTPNGYSIKPAFVRYPVRNFKRIGSRFSPTRLHPILYIIRPHLGVDFAADSGTPVNATSSGRVEFAGYSGGYGRVIKIKHGIYRTLYAHLKGFSSNIHPGSQVKQGQVIGYVGSSGLSTSPHLHYEFHINGKPQDPLKVKLPSGNMIAAEQRGSFFALSKKLLAQLDSRHKNYPMFAMSSNSKSKFKQ